MTKTAFLLALCTRRPTVPATSEPDINPARLHAMELRAEEFRKEKLLTLLGGQRTRRPTVPSTSEPDINPGRLYAMELRAAEFRKESLLRTHLSKCVHRHVDHILREQHVEEMRDHILLGRCFKKLSDDFHVRYERKGDEAIELLEQRSFIFKAVERQHANVVRHFINNDETIEPLPRFKRRHNPTLDLPTVTDMGNLGDVDTTSVPLPDQPQLDTPKQPVEEESRQIELTSVSLVLARAGLAGFENLSKFLGNFVKKARALITSFTGAAEVIEQKPKPRQPPVEEPSIVFGLRMEPDPLYRSATPDSDASVLEGFLPTKHKHTGRALLGSGEDHEYQPVKPGRPSSLTDHPVSIRTLDHPPMRKVVLNHRSRRPTRAVLSSDEHHEYQPATNPRPISPAYQPVALGTRIHKPTKIVDGKVVPRYHRFGRSLRPPRNQG